MSGIGLVDEVLLLEDEEFFVLVSMAALGSELADGTEMLFSCINDEM